MRELCFRWRRRQRTEELIVSYNHKSSLLSYPSRDSSTSSSSSIPPPDICFENNVYNYDLEPFSRAVIVDDGRIHAVAIKDDLPTKLWEKVTQEEVGCGPDAPQEATLESKGTDPLSLGQEQSTQAGVASDIFIMDKDAQDRQRRRDADRRDEPQSYQDDDEMPLSPEESLRLNFMPEISLGHDQIINIEEPQSSNESLQNKQNEEQEEDKLELASLSSSCNGIHSESDNTNNNASFWEDSFPFQDCMLESADL